MLNFFRRIISVDLDSLLKRTTAYVVRESPLLSATLVKTACAAHLFLDYALVPSATDGPSMLPTLEVAGERVWIDKRYRLGRGIEVGDIVAFQLPYDYGGKAGKRVVGMPGDYVLTGTPDSGNKEMAQVRWPSTQMNTIAIGSFTSLRSQVPKGHCWVIGDNLPASKDSRTWGALPLALIKGKIVAKGYPIFGALGIWGCAPFQWLENGLKPPSDVD
jgi:mitochondrial inner membrane protease subunit 1